MFLFVRNSLRAGMPAKSVLVCVVTVWYAGLSSCVEARQPSDTRDRSVVCNRALSFCYRISDLWIASIIKRICHGHTTLGGRADNLRSRELRSNERAGIACNSQILGARNCLGPCASGARG